MVCAKLSRETALIRATPDRDNLKSHVARVLDAKMTIPASFPRREVVDATIPATARPAREP